MPAVPILVFLFSSFLLAPSTSDLTTDPSPTKAEESDNCVIVYVDTDENDITFQTARISIIKDQVLAKFLEVQGHMSNLQASELIGRLISRGYKIASTVYTASNNPGQTIVWTLVRQ